MSFEYELKIDTIIEIDNHIRRMKQILLEIEPILSIDKHIDEVFRIFHSIKGNSQSAGFTTIATITHEIESFIFKIKSKEVKYCIEIHNMLIEITSHIDDGLEILKDDLEANLDFNNIYKILTILNDFTNNNIDSFENILNVLLIDDEEQIIEVLEMYLDEINLVEYKINSTTAPNGQRGLSVAFDHPFQIIITDFNMPEVDGIELITRIRNSDGPNCKTPIIMLTAFKPDITGNNSMWEKVFFMEKPINEKELSFFIKCAIKSNKAA